MIDPQGTPMVSGLESFIRICAAPKIEAEYDALVARVTAEEAAVPCVGCGTSFGIYEEYCAACWSKAALDVSAEAGVARERIADLEAQVERLTRERDAVSRQKHCPNCGATDRGCISCGAIWDSDPDT